MLKQLSHVKLAMQASIPGTDIFKKSTFIAGVDEGVAVTDADKVGDTVVLDVNEGDTDTLELTEEVWEGLGKEVVTVGDAVGKGETVAVQLKLSHWRSWRPERAFL